MAIPVMSVRVDADLVTRAKDQASADGIAWPDWVAEALRRMMGEFAVLTKAEMSSAAWPKPTKPQADRWNAKPTCKACGAPLIAGKCGNRECK